MRKSIRVCIVSLLAVVLTGCGAINAMSLSSSNRTYGNDSSSGTQITSLPVPIQALLQAVPVQQNVPHKLITLVESFMSYNDWKGSNSVPGTFTMSNGDHGSVNVNWTLTAKENVTMDALDPSQGDVTKTYKKGDKVTFSFLISENGMNVSYKNLNAEAFEQASGIVQN